MSSKSIVIQEVQVGDYVQIPTHFIGTVKLVAGDWVVIDFGRKRNPRPWKGLKKSLLRAWRYTEEKTIEEPKDTK